MSRESRRGFGSASLRWKDYIKALSEADGWGVPIVEILRRGLEMLVYDQPKYPKQKEHQEYSNVSLNYEHIDMAESMAHSGYSLVDIYGLAIEKYCKFTSQPGVDPEAYPGGPRRNLANFADKEVATDGLPQDHRDVPSS